MTPEQLDALLKQLDEGQELSLHYPVVEIIDAKPIEICRKCESSWPCPVEVTKEETSGKE